VIVWRLRWPCSFSSSSTAPALRFFLLLCPLLSSSSSFPNPTSLVQDLRRSSTLGSSRFHLPPSVSSNPLLILCCFLFFSSSTNGTPIRSVFGPDPDLPLNLNPLHHLRPPHLLRPARRLFGPRRRVPPFRLRRRRRRWLCSFSDWFGLDAWCSFVVSLVVVVWKEFWVLLSFFILRLGSLLLSFSPSSRSLSLALLLTDSPLAFLSFFLSSVRNVDNLWDLRFDRSS